MNKDLQANNLTNSQFYPIRNPIEVKQIEQYHNFIQKYDLGLATMIQEVPRNLINLKFMQV